MLTEAILHVTLAHTCIYACKEIQNPEFGKFLIKIVKISRDVKEISINLLHRCNKSIFMLGLQLFLKKNMHLSFSGSGNEFACITVTWCVISRLMTVG